YLACMGSGFQANGFNGMYSFGRGVPISGFRDPKIIRVADVTDGMSQTVAYSECIRAKGTFHRLSTVWRLPISLVLPGELDQFADACASIPLNPQDYGYHGLSNLRGSPWHSGGVFVALYNHVLTPNYPTCENGSDALRGACTASSFHPGGALSLYGDGHVEFTSTHVDRVVWRSLGSRSN
ncbi:MAG: DUF1559 domain-containing protein, partial [Planctomycetes bacterium]|nr:DUF1559 domain-containing protein [Planctomycetota bacterium]